MSYDDLMELTGIYTSSYSHTNQRHYFLHACYPRRHGLLSREASSVGFNRWLIADTRMDQQRSRRKENIFLGTRNQPSLSFSSVSSFALSLRSINITRWYPRDTLWKYDPAWIAGQWGACVRARSLWTRESRSNSIRPSKEPHGALLLDERTEIYEREPRRRSSMKRRDVNDWRSRSDRRTPEEDSDARVDHHIYPPSERELPSTKTPENSNNLSPLMVSTQSYMGCLSLKIDFVHYLEKLNNIGLIKFTGICLRIIMNIHMCTDLTRLN